jgi:hypothetical protein
MSGAILLVTWFLGQGQAQSYQVQFASLALCDTAKGQVLADADRLAGDVERNYSRAIRWGIPNPVRGPPAPTVSAVCVQG